ncbi:MAG: class I SAM-dependent rRNA methyltransferase [Planctomycetota bacterium]
MNPNLNTTRASLPHVRLKTSATGLRPWIYRKMVAANPNVANGSLVAIYGKPHTARVIEPAPGSEHLSQVRDGEIDASHAGVVAHGFYNYNSQIGLRIIRWGAEPVDEEYLRKRIRDAIYLRTQFLQLDSVSNAYRLVNSEGDELSGLIVDRYNNIASIEIHALAWHRRIAMIEEVVKKELGVERVVVRVDEKVERAEGFRARPRPEDTNAKTEIVENGVKFLIDFDAGHKTGAFLDQRDNREYLTKFVKNRDVLDICCYQGGFAIPAAVRGQAGRVVAVDLDEDAIAIAKKNAERNAAKRIEFVHSDGFDYLRGIAASKRRFDLVVLDPPKLVASKGDLHRGSSKYTDLNELGMRAIRNHGLLFTCSCSGLVPEDLFLGYLRKAAARAKRRVRILDIRGAGPDHPVSPQFPQGKYLKCVLASVEEI